MSYASLSVEELQSYFSDFHKDFYGFRPRGFGTDEQWNDRDWLIAQIESIHGSIESMKSTFKGREELREQGWAVEETDPELAKRAKWLADERKREQDEWFAKMDAEWAEQMEKAEIND
jgi:hypothetical protein